MVKVQGQNSKRKTVKQTTENNQKISDSGDEDTAGITSLVPDVKMSRLRIGL